MNSIYRWNQRLSLLGQTEQFRAKVGLVLSFVVNVLIIVVVPLRHALYPIELLQLCVLSLSILMMLAASIFIWRFPEGISGRILLISGAALITPLAAIYNGGLGAPAVPLAILLPIFASFLIGKRAAVVFLCLTLIIFVSIFVAGNLGALPDIVVHDEALREKMRLLVFSATAILAFAIGSVYERFRIRAQASENVAAQQDAIRTMVGTYNHEINNPLMIAMMHLEVMAEKGTAAPDAIEKVRIALKRIEKVTRTIRDISQSGDFLKDNYHGDTKVLKVS